MTMSPDSFRTAAPIGMFTAQLRLTAPVALVGLLALLCAAASVSAAMEPAADSASESMAGAWQEFERLYKKGAYRSSLDVAKAIHELAEATFDESDRRLAAATYTYGENLLRVRRYEESVAVLRTALERYEAILGEHSVGLIPTLLALSKADTSPRSGFKPHRKYLNRARRIASAAFDDSSESYADALLAIGRVSVLRGDDDDVGEARKIYRGVLGDRHLKTATATLALAQHAMIEDHRGDAERYLQEVLTMLDVDDGRSREALIVAHGMLVQLYERSGDRDAATPHCITIGQLQQELPERDYLPLVRTAPRYPIAALRSRTTGWVDLRYGVDKAGFVVDPEATGYEGSSAFVPAALEALESFRYASWFEDGEPTDVSGAEIRITFRIGQ